MDASASRLDCYFKTSPVFMDQRTRSSSSKSIRTSRANRISCCSTSRYFLRVEGGLAESITPTSAKHRITCLSRIACPFTPMFRRKWLASLYPNPLTCFSWASQSRRSNGSEKLRKRFRNAMPQSARKVVARSYDVTRPCHRKAMRAGFLQRRRHRIRVTLEQQWSHSGNSTQAHASRGAGSENAIGQLFPKPRVGSFAPNFFKLTEPLANLFASCSVSGYHSFNCNGFLITLHCSLSTPRFYERVRSIVNDKASCIYQCKSVAGSCYDAWPAGPAGLRILVDSLCIKVAPMMSRSTQLLLLSLLTLVLCSSGAAQVPVASPSPQPSPRFASASPRRRTPVRFTVCKAY